MTPETYSFTVGDFACRCVSDGTFDYPPDTFVANVPTERFLEELQAAGQPTDHVTSPYSSLLITTGTHTVLVDTGAGFAPTNGHLLHNLQVAGIAPSAVDTVVLTHAHADHIGGNLTSAGRPTFPNARYVLSQTEWDFWTRMPNLDAMPVDAHLKQLLIAAAQHNLLPLVDQLVLIDGETEIVPGIWALPAPGHTPGQIALRIASGSQQLLHLADIVLHPILMEHRDWYSRVDLLPEQTLVTKRRLLAEAAADHIPAFVYHFAPFPSIGYVRAKGNAWQWHPGQAIGATADAAG